MSFSGSVDSVPTFKKALQDLKGQYSNSSKLSAILDEVQVFSHTLNRHADQKLLRQAMSGLELLIQSLSVLSGESATSQTSMFSIENFADDSLANHFDDLFTKLSASLPNVFNADDEERARAVDSTIKHLEEIGRFAEIHGNSHVVGLSDAMVSVVKYNKESLIESGSDSDNTFLVKPLLRGFALLRTAFDSPDEPNLSPALIDSTANLRDLIGEQVSSHSTFDFDYDNSVEDNLSDETVVETSQPQMKPIRRNIESKKTVAFQSISALVPPEDAKDDQKEELFRILEEESNRSNETETSVEANQEKPKRIDALVYGFLHSDKKLQRFGKAFPLNTTVVSKSDDVLTKLKSERFDIIICNGELDEKKLNAVIDYIDSLESDFQLPIAIATSIDDFTLDIVFPRETPEFSKYLLKNIVIEEDDVPDLFE